MSQRTLWCLLAALLVIPAVLGAPALTADGAAPEHAVAVADTAADEAPTRLRLKRTSGGVTEDGKVGGMWGMPAYMTTFLAGLGGYGPDGQPLAAATDGNSDCAAYIASKFNGTCHEPECADLVPGYINYIKFFECTASNGGARFFAVILLLTWMAFLLHLVETTTNDYFCTSLTVAVSILNMSPNVAGVTFLAVGNAACDVIASIAAFSTGVADVGIGTTLGAGIFVTTAVVAVVAFVSDVRLPRRSFVRDVVFFIITVVYLLITALDGVITVPESAGFIGIYVVFVAIVAGGRWIKALRSDEEGEQDAAAAAVAAAATDAGTYQSPTLVDGAVVAAEGGSSASADPLSQDIYASLEAARQRATTRVSRVNASDELARLRRKKLHYFAEDDEDDDGYGYDGEYVMGAGGDSDSDAEGGDLGVGSGDAIHAVAEHETGMPAMPGSNVVSSRAARAAQAAASAELRRRSRSSSFVDDLPKKPSRWTRAFLKTQGEDGTLKYAPFQWSRYHKRKLAKELAARLVSRGATTITTPDGTVVYFLELLTRDIDAAGELAAAMGASVTAAATRTGDRVTYSEAAALAALAVQNVAANGHETLIVPPGGRAALAGTVTTASGGISSASGADGLGVQDVLMMMPKETLKPTARVYQRMRKVLGYVAPAYSRFMHTAEVPVIAARKLSIPILHEGAYRRRWMCLVMPGTFAFFTIILTTHILKGSATSTGGFPYWCIAAIAGAVFGLIMHLFLLPRKGGKPCGGRGGADGSKASLLANPGGSERPQSVTFAEGTLGGEEGGEGGHLTEAGRPAAAAAHRPHHRRPWYKRLGIMVAGPNDEPMPKGPIFAFLLVLSFLMSLFWLLLIANEIVGVAIFLGKVAGVPDVVMGLTVLAVGNSINDLAASLTIARDGYPQMAIAGAYAGPMFNVLAGIGLPMLLFQKPQLHCVGKPTLLVWASFITLVGSLVLVLAWVPFEGWRITRKIGRTLCFIFFAFIALVCIAGFSGLEKGSGEVAPEWEATCAHESSA